MAYSSCSILHRGGNFLVYSVPTYIGDTKLRSKILPPFPSSILPEETTENHSVNKHLLPERNPHGEEVCFGLCMKHLHVCSSQIKQLVVEQNTSHLSTSKGTLSRSYTNSFFTRNLSTHALDTTARQALLLSVCARVKFGSATVTHVNPDIEIPPSRGPTHVLLQNQ